MSDLLVESLLTLSGSLETKLHFKLTHRKREISLSNSQPFSKFSPSSTFHLPPSSPTAFRSASSFYSPAPEILR
ncbi:hypothetical protein SDJN03_25982, partial [Cucurbita argyrosperma subsp. sororia]